MFSLCLWSGVWRLELSSRVRSDRTFRISNPAPLTLGLIPRRYRGVRQPICQATGIVCCCYSFFTPKYTIWNFSQRPRTMLPYTEAV